MKVREREDNGLTSIQSWQSRVQLVCCTWCSNYWHSSPIYASGKTIPETEEEKEEQGSAMALAEASLEARSYISTTS
jgi:hypothetical protein